MSETVVLIRHGDKDGDKLTVTGVIQIEKTVEKLLEMGYVPEVLYHSGTNRTAQCATVCVMTINRLGTPNSNKGPEVEPGLHYEKPFKEGFGGDLEAFNAEIEKIRAIGGMVSDALNISRYARIARQQVIEPVLRMAASSKISFGFSHSPLITLACASDEKSEVPYEMKEATAIVYTVEDGHIVSSTLFQVGD